ncbi:hypothetical protein ACQE3E_02660 [Methylomonas sp. MED-D]|uniref:hypothetical protein n=1 Tax=unclassified Methylomonas TaxID=2608980 RepID=UPI00143C9560|nr:MULTISPECIES: hypothetical protein [unclassified Methylomonas]MDT4330193.1 hypothetical protein [Methylomonas sp. MV1]NJA05629.1 hypothetical protein [Methylococcaceae bacterium WWC4]WGS86669.1 hypothetical protein QC632_02660 [Methylomonas sp. UP202]
MSSKRQKSAVPVNGKVEAPISNLPRDEAPDDRYPGTFFRVPGVPMPGKTTWSLAK